MARVGDHVDRLEREQRVAVDQVVQSPGTHGEAGHDLVALARLPPPGEDALLQQRNDRVGDHVRVDAQVPAVGQVLERRVGDAAQADLQRRAVLDDAADVAGDLLDDLILGRRMDVLADGRRHGHQTVDAVDVQHRVAHGPRHRWIDLGDDQTRLGDRRWDHVHRNAKAHVAVLVGHRHLDEGDVDANAPVLDQLRYPRDRHRYVFGKPLLDRRADVGTDEEGPMLEARRRAALVVVWHRAAGDEVHELDVRRCMLHRLQRSHQGARRGTRGADEDVTAADDSLNRVRCRRHLGGPGTEARVERRGLPDRCSAAGCEGAEQSPRQPRQQPGRGIADGAWFDDIVGHGGAQVRTSRKCRRGVLRAMDTGAAFHGSVCRQFAVPST